MNNEISCWDGKIQADKRVPTSPLQHQVWKMWQGVFESKGPEEAQTGSSFILAQAPPSKSSFSSKRPSLVSSMMTLELNSPFLFARPLGMTSWQDPLAVHVRAISGCLNARRRYWMSSQSVLSQREIGDNGLYRILSQKGHQTSLSASFWILDNLLVCRNVLRQTYGFYHVHLGSGIRASYPFCCQTCFCSYDVRPPMALVPFPVFSRQHTYEAAYRCPWTWHTHFHLCMF